MAPKITFDESVAFEHYYAHETDSAIGRAVGKDHRAIHSWRKRRGLPSIAINHLTKKSYTGGIDYRKVLTPEQALKMNKFLRALSRTGAKAIKAGEKPNITLFLKAWRGEPVSKEEKIEHRRRQGRQYDAKRRGKVAIS